jgi:hypothetical protein
MDTVGTFAREADAADAAAVSETPPRWALIAVGVDRDGIRQEQTGVGLDASQYCGDGCH